MSGHDLGLDLLNHPFIVSGWHNLDRYDEPAIVVLLATRTPLPCIQLGVRLIAPDVYDQAVGKADSASTPDADAGFQQLLRDDMLAEYLNTCGTIDKAQDSTMVIGSLREQFFF
jgi:hypothetical protein